MTAVYCTGADGRTGWVESWDWDASGMKVVGVRLTLSVARTHVFGDSAFERGIRNSVVSYLQDNRKDYGTLCLFTKEAVL